MGVEPEAPRLCARQRHRSNTIIHSDNTPAESISTHYRVNLHNPFLDHLIAELNSRVVSVANRVQTQYLLPHRLAQLT